VTPAPFLSPAETRVVAEIARGGDYAAIAARLHLSIHTIKTTRRRAIRHMGATSTAHLVALAIAHRLIPQAPTYPPRRTDPMPSYEDTYDRIAALTAERDGAYRERAHLLAWLATHYPAVIAPAPDVDEPGWQLLYLTAPTGQLSWHIAPRDASLFAHVQRVTTTHPRAQWDGHTTEEKYERIRLLPARAETERDSVKRVGPTRQQDATSAEDACRVVEVGGEPIRVRGSGEMSDESRAALAEVIGAARAKCVAEHPDGAPVISPRVAAHVLWQEGLGGYAAGSFTTALLKAWWAADPANAARLARTWPEYGAAIALLGQPGGTEQLRAITGEQPTPDRP
jgi:DNA-binding CsgD family transcriptional regulator